jgi:glycosyltransferase involved in cell wall biosynthesis
LYGPAQLDHVYINTIKNPLIRKTIAFLQRGIDKETISMLQHNICLANSRFTISYISSILKNCQCELLYPPCEVQYFKIPKNRLTNKKDIVLTVGRISPEKRYELVIHLAKALKQYHFIIAGKLENWKYYASLVKLMKREEVHNVKILTNVHKSCLRELYWNSKIYVHAMRGEHFGKTVVEAMAGGCIPLVPSTGGCKEVVGRDDYTFEDDQDAVNKLYQLTSSWTEHQALEAVERSKSFDVNVYKKSFLHILRKYS